MRSLKDRLDDCIFDIRFVQLLNNSDMKDLFGTDFKTNSLHIDKNTYRYVFEESYALYSVTYHESNLYRYRLFFDLGLYTKIDETQMSFYKTFLPCNIDEATVLYRIMNHPSCRLFGLFK
jgi:hypothetical protein